MRLGGIFFVLALAGIATAQDSNFPSGPQYLMNYGSPLQLHSIATPSLTLGAAPPASAAAEAEAGEGVQLSISRTITTPPDLHSIYYGAPESTDKSSVVEISSTQPPQPVPASIADVGTTGTISVQALRESGYGVPLGDVASFWKTHGPHSAHLYTNRDIERLRGN